MMQSGELRKIYALWIEYLRRSIAYKELCDYIRKNHSVILQPVPEQYKGREYLLVNYLMFGDIYNRNLEEVLYSIENFNLLASPVCNYAYHIEGDIDRILDSIKKTKKGDPTVSELKTSIIDLINDELTLYLRINPLRGSEEELIEEVSKEIKRLRSILHLDKLNVTPKSFLNKSSRIRYDELRRYLEVYDAKIERGLDIKLIIKKMAPDKDPKDVNVQRSFNRDLSNARKIIENVEKMQFPGNY